MKAKIKTLLIGTSDFAVPIFDALSGADFIEVVGIVTQPDRPVGRHQSEFEFSAVKKWAIKDLTDKDGVLQVKLFQPERLKSEAERILAETKPELIIVASYGQMVPTIMLDYPKFKCLNVHASLLPDLRGAVPMPMAILKGYEETGVSIPIMTPGLDDGDLIGQRKFKLEADETTASLTVKAADAGAKLLIEILSDWFAGKIKPIPQDLSKATYCTQADLAKENAELLPTESAIDIDRKVRAFYPWPVAWAFLRSAEADKKEHGIEANNDFAGKRLKIFKVRILDTAYNHKKNLKLFKLGNRLILRADVGWIEILECQLEGKNRLLGSDYIYLANDKAESVRGVIIDDGRMLLMYRKKGNEEYFVIPGGSIGVKESIEDALKREIKEETNLDIDITRHMYTDIEIIGNGAIQYKHYCYLCKLIGESKDAKIIGEENQYNKDTNFYELRWVAIKELSNINLVKKDLIIAALPK